MRFWSWLFSVNRRHRNGMRRYEKGGAGVRLFTLLLAIALAAATLALEWWSIALFQENLLVGVLAFALLACPLCIATAEFSLVYAFVGFRMFFHGVADRAAYREAKRRAREGATQNGVTGAANAADGAQGAPKTHRAFDMFLFVFGLLVGIGIIIAFIACFVAWL